MVNSTKRVTSVTAFLKTVTPRAGKLIRNIFNIGGEKLEPVQTFCYLGYEISASGSNSTTINYLYDNASKAMQTIFKTVAWFNIPIKTLTLI